MTKHREEDFGLESGAESSGQSQSLNTLQASQLKEKASLSGTNLSLQNQTFFNLSEIEGTRHQEQALR